MASCVPAIEDDQAPGYTAPGDTPALLVDTSGSSNDRTTLIDAVPEVFENSWDTIPLGDADGDGTLDTAFVVGPPIDWEIHDCVDTCNARVEFSNGWPNLYSQNDIGGQWQVVGDLDGDGLLDFGYVPEWLGSCWGNIFIYRYGTKGWEKITSRGIRQCDVMDMDTIVLPLTPGKFLLKHYRWDEEQVDRFWVTDTVVIVP